FHDRELRPPGGAVELPLFEVELRRFDLRPRQRDLVLGVGVIQVHGSRVLENREVPVVEGLFLLALPEGLRFRAGHQNRKSQGRPELSRHRHVDLSVEEVIPTLLHGAIGRRRTSVQGPTNPTSIDSYPTFLMMYRSNTTSPARAFTTLSPAASTAIGSSFGPKEPMNLKVISGGLGVGVGVGGGGGGHCPKNRGSPQTGTGVGTGGCAGTDVGVGGLKMKMFRETAPVGAPTASRSRRSKKGRSSAVSFFVSPRPRLRFDAASSPSTPGAAAGAGRRLGTAASSRLKGTRARTSRPARTASKASWRRLPTEIFMAVEEPSESPPTRQRVFPHRRKRQKPASGQGRCRAPRYLARCRCRG